MANIKKPRSEAKTLIKLCAVKMLKNALGKEAVQKVKRLQNVICSRIDDIVKLDTGADILNQVVSDIKASFAEILVQSDETTDASNCSKLMVFACYIKRNVINEHIVFCKQLQPTTTTRDIFNLLKSFFNTYDILLQDIRSVCTDGAPAMLRNRSGFLTHMKNKIQEVAATRCILHRQIFDSKTLPVTLKNVMD